MVLNVIPMKAIVVIVVWTLLFLNDFYNSIFIVLDVNGPLHKVGLTEHTLTSLNVTFLLE